MHLEESSSKRKVKIGRQWARWTVIGIEFCILFIFWVCLSGRFQVRYLLIGVGAAALVTFLTNDLLYSSYGSKKYPELGAGYVLKSTGRWIAYLPWLVLAIIKANIQVASIILNPKLPIDPVMLKFKTNLKKKASLVTLANSITITPGTITVDQKGATFIVHAIVKGAAGDLESGLMQNKAAAIFDDDRCSVPDCLWAHYNEELKQ